MFHRIRIPLMATTIFIAAIGAGGIALSSPAQARVEVFLDVAPPPPPVEVVPEPRMGFVWAPGYYAYRGREHVWVPGHYIRERHGFHWVADGWEEHHGRYHYIPGHWVR